MSNGKGPQPRAYDPKAYDAGFQNIKWNRDPEKDIAKSASARKTDAARDAGEWRRRNVK